MRTRTLLSVGLLAAFTVAPAAAQDGAGNTTDDPVFSAMEAELARAQTLRMKDMDAPYHLHAYVSDSESFSVAASFGALTSKGGGRGATTSVGVRVGGAELDNTNFSGGFSFSMSFGGGGSPPLDHDADALRRALWKDFDSEFKSAVETMAKKRAYLAANTVKDRQPDFGDAPVEDVIEPRKALELDREEWTGIVKRVSGVFRKYDAVHRCRVDLDVGVSHQYFISTDPTRHRFPVLSASVSMSAGTQAEDGMSVRVGWSIREWTADRLPGETELAAKAHELGQRLEALAKSPTADDYWGPVLFVDQAAAQFFLETVGGPLSKPRQDLGASAGGRLIDRMDRRIAATQITAVDDPTQKEFGGRQLMGYFPIDDDGVRPSAITLIDKGFLRTHYMSRVPTKHVKVTNGHSRAGDGSTGNLFIRTSEGFTQAQLEAKLMELVAVEDLEYGLVVAQMGGGSSGFSFGPRRGISLSSPSLVYRLYRDGRRELQRGASFERASYRVLRDIVALGDTPHVLNTRQFGQHVSVVAPAVLVSELELRRPREEHSKPPYSERPPMAR